MIPKPIRQEDPEFREWISKLPCEICKSPGVEHDDGSYRNHPSHVLTRGAGHGDYDNLLPHCWIHHQNHEKAPIYEKQTWLHRARAYTQRYFNEIGKWREDDEHALDGEANPTTRKALAL